MFSSFKQAMNLNRQRNGNGGANGRIYDAIAKWYSETLDTSGGPFYGSKKSLNPFNSLNIGSIDHVWEKSNVGDFLASLIGTEFDCDDLNSLFSSSKLQNIFDQLPSMDPSNVQPGFAAMNRNINGMKGWMFSQGLSSTIFRRIYNSDDKIIQGIERQAIIFDWFNSDPGIQSMHDKTNNRIYSAFLALDDHISTKKIQRAKGRGDLTQKFGPTFKNWYEQLLGKTGSETWAWASGEVTRMNADTSLRKCFRDAINIIRSSPLYGEDKFKIDPSHLTWTATSVTLPSVSPTTAIPTSTRPVTATSTETGTPSPISTSATSVLTISSSPSSSSSSSTSPSSSPSSSPSPSSAKCTVPDGCLEAVSTPDGCVYLCP